MILLPYSSNDSREETDVVEIDGSNKGIFVFALTFSPVGASALSVYSIPASNGNSLVGKAYHKLSGSKIKVSTMPFPEIVTCKSDGGSFPMSDALNTGLDHVMFARIKSTESEIKHETDSLGGVSGNLIVASSSQEKKTISKGRKNASFFIS